MRSNKDTNNCDQMPSRMSFTHATPVFCLYYCTTGCHYYDVSKTYYLQHPIELSIFYDLSLIEHENEIG